MQMLIQQKREFSSKAYLPLTTSKLTSFIKNDKGQNFFWSNQVSSIFSESSLCTGSILGFFDRIPEVTLFVLQIKNI